MLPVRLSDDKYQETKDILLQKTKPTPLVSEFADWFSQEYYAKLLNIDFTKYNLNGLDVKHSLIIIIDDRTGKIKYPELSLEYRIHIKEKFIELANKYNLAKLQNLGEIENISVCIFSDTSQIVIMEKTIEEATIFLKKKYPEIFILQRWHNSMAIIYHSDTQAEENEKIGINKMIINDFFAFVKKHDDVNCFKQPPSGIFVSQETLNRSYLGKLHYYMR